MKRRCLFSLLALTFLSQKAFSLSSKDEELIAKHLNEYHSQFQAHGVSFVEKVCDITQYGAKGDNSTLNTQAIQSAIEDCGSGSNSSANGSLNLVIFPRSKLKEGEETIYVSGALFLESNIGLYFEEGVRLLGIANKSNVYWPIIYTRRAGYMNMTDASLINGGICESIEYNKSAIGDQCNKWKRLSNVMIYGKGVIDGNGASGWWNKDDPTLWNNRPCLLQLTWITNLSLFDFTVTNSPFWTVHPLFSTHILIENITINTVGPNTDGIDPDSCEDVTIKGCFISTGDDCIAIKSGMDADGRAVGIPSNHILVENMYFRSGHGISIGSDMSGNVTNVLFRNLTLDGTDKGPRIKSERGRGGMVANITYENLNVKVGMGISISEYYNSGAEGVPPLFRDINILNMSGSASTAGQFDCLPESPCHGIVLENINIDSSNGFSCENAYGTSTNVSPTSCLKSDP